MSGFGGDSRSCRFLRLVWLGAVCLALGNCASGNMATRGDSNLVAAPKTADTRPEHPRIVSDADRSSVQYVPDVSNGRATIIGARPTQCPYSFCGCEASLYLFGHVNPELNLASNWMRKFPRTAPAPGMAAVRNHHVFVLMNHVDGSDWLVHDGNSGHGLTREHVRSIRGYIVVNPQGGNVPEARLARAE